MYYDFKEALPVVADLLATKSGRDANDLKQFLIDDIEAATEAVDSRTGMRTSGYTSKYLNYLIEKTVSKAEKINWGSIPASKGNITRWKEYKCIATALDMIKKVNINNDIINTALELERNIITYRADFEYGYKTDNTVIILTYQSACYALLDISMLASISLEADMYNKAASRTAIRVGVDSKAKHFVKSVKQLNRCFQSGEWSKMVRTLKTTRIDAFYASKAQEALESAAAVAAGIGTFAIIAAVSITGAIALISAIRGLITIYYRTAVTIDQKARSMQEYLDEVIPYEQNADAAKKQIKARDKLDRLAGWIEARIINDSIAAEKQIAEEDMKEVSPAALNTPDDMDIQFF